MERNSNMFHMTKPVAGSFAFPAIKDPNGSISALCKEWVEEGNVMLLPSNLYDFDDVEILPTSLKMKNLI